MRLSQIKDISFVYVRGTIWRDEANLILISSSECCQIISHISSVRFFTELSSECWTIAWGESRRVEKPSSSHFCLRYLASLTSVFIILYVERMKMEWDMHKYENCQLEMAISWSVGGKWFQSRVSWCHLIRPLPKKNLFLYFSLLRSALLNERHFMYIFMMPTKLLYSWRGEENSFNFWYYFSFN